MIEIITPSNRHLYEPEIESMFRLRYRLLVEQWGWRIPSLRGNRDCDSFDTDETIYFIECAQESRRVICCARLNPTTRPHMFSDVFAGNCDLSGVPRGHDILEASRFALERNGLQIRQLHKLKGRLEWAVTYYGIQNQIRQMTWFMSKEVYARYIRFWRPTTPLGLPTQFGDDERFYIPAISKIDPDALTRLADHYGLDDQSVIVGQRSENGEFATASIHSSTEKARAAA